MALDFYHVSLRALYSESSKVFAEVETLTGSDTLPRIKIPQLGRQIVRRRKESPRWGELEMINPVIVAPEREGLFRVEVENLDAVVFGAGREDLAVKVQRQHAVRVTTERGKTLSSPPVPLLGPID